MSTWTNTITTKGLELLNGTITGGTIQITKAVSGSSRVPLTELMQQITIADTKQNLNIQQTRKGDDGATEIQVILTNTELTESYSLSQVGLYAIHPEEGEILFAIAQIDTKKDIPTNEASPGYTIELYFKFHLTNEANIIIVNPGPFVTVESVELIVKEQVSKLTAKDVGARPDTWLPTAKEIGAVTSDIPIHLSITPDGILQFTYDETGEEIEE
ncbi:MAG: hypothetical protein IKW37_01570 [Bacteroidaceae bacterium]|nr:hypothetical protein [Bacteroidaceae bacterium]